MKKNAVKIRSTTHAMKQFEKRFPDMAKKFNSGTAIKMLCRAGRLDRRFRQDSVSRSPSIAFINGQFAAIVKRLEYQSYLVITVLRMQD